VCYECLLCGKEKGNEGELDEVHGCGQWFAASG
jgi:hypothetical protein